MKLNLVNKLYISIAVLLFICLSYKIINYKGWERFYYFSSVSAPADYPVFIEKILFQLPDKEDSHDFYQSRDENVNAFRTGWGEEYYSAWVHKPLRLPEKLVIEYASYSEQKFYSGVIDLPGPEILEIFKAAIKEKQAAKLSSSGGDKLGLRFVVGIAPKGNIVVWLRGVYLEKKILQTKIESVNSQGKVLPGKDNAALNLLFKELSDSVKLELKKGSGTPANYLDSSTHYIEQNKELWEYQKKNHFID